LNPDLTEKVDARGLASPGRQSSGKHTKTAREGGPLSLNLEPLAMSFTTDDADLVIAELGASLTPSQYSAFTAAAHAALGNCSGPGAAYRILRDLQRNFFDPPVDDPNRCAPRHRYHWPRG